MELKILEVELISECGKLPQLPLDVILIIHWQPAGPLCRSSLGGKFFPLDKTGATDDSNELCTNFIAETPDYFASAFLDNPVVGKEEYELLRHL